MNLGCVAGLGVAEKLHFGTWVFVLKGLGVWGSVKDGILLKFDLEKVPKLFGVVVLRRVSLSALISIEQAMENTCW